MDLERDLIRNELLNPDFQESFAKHKFCFTAKSCKISTEARQEGNQLYKRKDHNAEVHKNIFSLYSKSIAFAPNPTEELALAYGNRSALLLHLKNYRECITDVGRAISITKSNALKIKLLCRRVECLIAVGSPKGQESLGEAIDIFDRISENDQDRDNLAKLIEKCKISLSFDRGRGSPRVDNSVNEFLKSAPRAESLSNVDIKYSEKYGRHLVAARNFKPGEVIHVEKPYASVPNDAIPYMYCSHCLNLALSGVPCKSCNYYIFCSEKCRDEAWKTYHDAECSIIPYVNGIQINQDIRYGFQLGMRILIMRLKELGSLEKLQSELRSINEHTAKNVKEFIKNEKFKNNRFKNICSLSHDTPVHVANTYTRITAMYLCYLVKYSSIFETESLKNMTLGDLADNEDVLFLGSLHLKLTKICFLNTFLVSNENYLHEASIQSVGGRGVGLASISSLFNNNCIPNVRRCHMENLDVTFYALEPIEKNAQLFICYFCNFYDAPNTIDRKSELKEYYHFTCDCLACERNWPPLLNPAGHIGTILPAMGMAEAQLLDEYNHILSWIENDNPQFDKTTIPFLVSGIEKASKAIAQPSLLRCLLMYFLQKAFEKFYGYNTELFNKCKN